MSYFDFAQMLKGYEEEHYQKWEHTRQIAFTIYRANCDPKKAEKSIYRWMPLPTDPKPQKIKISAAQKRKIAAAKERLNKLN